MDLLNKMATFVRVVESGSLSAASKQLRISSAAVSRQLSTLEAELGVSLMTRTTRRIATTPEGRRYYERCVRILRDVEEAGRTDALDGSLKVTAPVTFGLACVVPQMASLLAKHPKLVVDLQIDDRLVDLIPEGLDVAIRVGGYMASTELVAHRLMRYRRTLVASPAYLKRRGVPGTPEALAKNDALAMLTGTSDTWTLRQGDLEVRVRPCVIFRSNALVALLDLARAGAGIALLPEWFVRPALAAGQLRNVLPTWTTALVTASAIYRKDQRAAPRIRAFVDHLAAALAVGTHERLVSS